MNEKQFKCCIMPHYKTLFAYALAILDDECDAADCLQEAMTRLWEMRSRLEKIDNPAAYASATVKNIAVSMASKKKRFVDAFGNEAPEYADPAPPPDAAAENRDDLQRIGKLMRLLPENQRKVMVMSAVGGLSNLEIKEATGLSDENVRVLLSRGRKRLRQLFSL